MNEKQTQYKNGTPQSVKLLLEGLMGTNRRVRLFYGDKETGEYWGDEYDVTGTIGRSTGPQPIPLLINNRRSMGGSSILTDCVVRMLVDGREVYRHPRYFSRYETAHVRPSEMSGYSHEVVSTQRGVEARFHNEKSARNWLAFMRGERMAK